MNITPWCNRVIKISFYLLFGLVPLLLTPVNYELFEYNKMMAVYGLTAIIACAWIIKMIAGRQLRIVRTPLDLPIGLFFLSQLVSSLFSMDPHISWFGYYSRFNGGMFSITSYVFLYYAFVSNCSGETAPSNRLTIFRFLNVALSTGVIVALYGVAERLGIDKSWWVQDVQTRVFSTLGQPNWLAAYLVALSPISWYFFLASQPEVRPAQRGAAPPSPYSIVLNVRFVVYSSVAVLLFIVLLFTRSRSGLVALSLADLFFWCTLLLTIPTKKRLVVPFGLLHAAFVIIIVLNGTNIPQIDRYLRLSSWFQRTQTPAPMTEKAATAAAQTQGYTPPLLEYGGTESGVIRQYVWQAAITAWRSSVKTIAIGTGTETFASAFYQFRPKAHNLTSEWDFLYNKAHNEYLNYLATTGLFGLGSYLFFIGSFTWWFIKVQSSKLKVQTNIKAQNSKQHALDFGFDLPFGFWTLNGALFAGWLSVLVTNFFGFSVVVVQLLFFLLPAIAVVMGADSQRAWIKSFTLKQRTAQVTQVLMLIAGIVVLGVLVVAWDADRLFAAGYRRNRAGSAAGAALLIDQAIALNPTEPFYHDEYSTALAALAVDAVDGKNASRASQLAQQAISESDIALSIAPNNVNYWKTRTKLLYAFAAFDPQFYDLALETLVKAQKLSPTDPKISYNIAILAGRKGDIEKAKAALRQAIDLKPNYRDAYYALYVFYADGKQTDLARQVLEEYLTRVNPADREFMELVK